MERQHMNKKRRVYSPEPYDIIETTFTRKYVSYLAPAIMHVRKNMPTDHENGHFFESSKKINHEVDMALALSSQGFAWSSALKDRLQKKINIDYPAYIQTPSNHHSIECQNSNDNVEEKLSGRLSIPNAVYQSMSKPNRDVPNKSLVLQASKEEEKEEAEESEDNHVENRLEYLKTLIPGGNNMEGAEFFRELRGYIICLDLQVNVLRHLVDLV